MVVAHYGLMDLVISQVTHDYLSGNTLNKKRGIPF
jgi:hypothetical protein